MANCPRCRKTFFAWTAPLCTAFTGPIGEFVYRDIGESVIIPPEPFLTVLDNAYAAMPHHTPRRDQ